MFLHHSRTIPPKTDFVDEWLAAINDTTYCLRLKSARNEDLDMCAMQLKEMEAYLRKKESKWDFSPDRPPPQLDPSLAMETSASSSSSAEEGGGSNWGVHSTTAFPMLGNNRYASFQDFSSDDEGETEEDSQVPLVRRAPRRPTSVLSPSPSVVQSMDMRRIYVRILDAQASLSLRRAFNCRNNQEWNRGAGYYENCLQLIHAAIYHCDAAISKLIHSRMAPTFPLEDDANIVHVAIQSMANGREQFLMAAKKQEAYLLRKLEPQWEKRDEIKNRMGDRWFENRRPSNSFANLRKEQEKELADVQKAMRSLQTLDLDKAEESTVLLQQKLGKSSKERYNGKRPTDYSRRVCWEKFPDPTEFGWNFTGSSGVTEFFEKENVKLDWYFTTGTVKTSLDHPVQGKTQLFADRVDPETFAQILLDPRAHTGKRYRRRSNRRPQSKTSPGN